MRFCLHFMRVFKLATNVPWAMREETLAELLRIAALCREERFGNLESVRAEVERIRAVRQLEGTRLEKARNAVRRGPVAVLPIEGPIVRRADLFSDVSGMTSIESLATDLRIAMDAPDISAVLLEVDSPGGEVAGISEFASMVREASQSKTVWAYVDDDACSAAYWIASAASRIIASPTATLGSIGVIGSVRDTTEEDARRGVVRFVSSVSPNKRPDLSTEEGRSELQRVVDDLAAVFVKNVADYRGISEADVLEKFGRGGVLIGAGAVEAGMADSLGTFEGTLSELAAEARTPRRAAVVALHEGKGETRSMGLWDEVKGLFAKHGVPTEDEETLLPTAVVDERFEAAALRQQLADVENRLNEANQRSLALEASNWVQSLGSKATPAQKAQLTERYPKMAALGAEALGEWKAGWDERPANDLTQELVKNEVQGIALPNVTANGDAPPSEERKKELLALTPLGRTAQANGKGG
jgi:signal peptide peptidase SppA